WLALPLLEVDAAALVDRGRHLLVVVEREGREAEALLDSPALDDLVLAAGLAAEVLEELPGGLDDVVAAVPRVVRHRVEAHEADGRVPRARHQRHAQVPALLVLPECGL